jgi:hypothetical protein
MALAVAIGITIAPLIYESAAVCVARWKSVLGQVTTADTPVLNAIGAGIQTASRTVQGSTSSLFRTMPWKPSLVIPLTFAWAILAAVLLRRR